MKREYREWIDEYVKENNGRVVGLCQSAVMRMLDVFPELKPVPGWCAGYEHHWLVTDEGEIVDPTFSQFVEYGLAVVDADYKPWAPGDRVRVGKCMNCGVEIYAAVEELGGAKKDICSDACFNDYANYCQGFL